MSRESVVNATLHRENMSSITGHESLSKVASHSAKVCAGSTATDEVVPSIPPCPRSFEIRWRPCTGLRTTLSGGRSAILPCVDSWNLPSPGRSNYAPDLPQGERWLRPLRWRDRTFVFGFRPASRGIAFYEPYACAVTWENFCIHGNTHP